MQNMHPQAEVYWLAFQDRSKPYIFQCTTLSKMGLKNSWMYLYPYISSIIVLFLIKGHRKLSKITLLQVWYILLNAHRFANLIQIGM